MIPQQLPLYAIDTRDQSAYIVIAWRGHHTTAEMLPVVAPCDAPGTVRPHPCPGVLVYGTLPPSAITGPPAPDETVVMSRPERWDGGRP